MSAAAPLIDAPRQIAHWLSAARSAVAFTGAGISTESGIPDFRSPGGIWSQSQPVYFDEFLRRPEARYEYWRQKAVSHRDFEHARPNIAHTLLAEWESAGRIRFSIAVSRASLPSSGVYTPLPTVAPPLLP